MTLEGKQLIGQQAVLSNGNAIHAVDPATGETLEPGYKAGSRAEVEHACELAWTAFDAYRETGLEVRACFLETIAEEIESIGDDLIVRAMAESGLPRGRLEGERGPPPPLGGGAHPPHPGGGPWAQASERSERAL